MTKIETWTVINKAEQLRKALGLTLSDFSSYCEVNVATYRKYVVEATPDALGTRRGIYMLIEDGIKRKSAEVSAALEEINKEVLQTA